MKKIKYLILLGFFAGCLSDNTPYFVEIKSDQGGLYRGVSIRDGAEKVKMAENEEYKILDEGVFLKYEYPLDAKEEEKGSYEVEYYFDGEDQLHEIIINVYLMDKKETEALYQQFIADFSTRYGTYEVNQEGYLVWNGVTENTNELEIALIKERSFDDSKGYISLQINDFDY